MRLVNSLDKLIADIKDDPKIKRLKELEEYIDKDKDITSLLNKKKHISKEMVLARKLNLLNTYDEYKKEYDQIDDKIGNSLFVEEYMDLLNDAHNDLEIMIDYLEKNINKNLN